MNKRQRKKRRKLHPTYEKWLVNILKKICDDYDIDPDSAGVKDIKEMKCER